MKGFVARVALLFAVTASCASELDVQPTAVELAESQCRAHLADANYSGALQAAARVVVKQPALLTGDLPSNQLRFCYVTARTLGDLDETSTRLKKLITSVSSLIEGRASASPRAWETHAGGLSTLVIAILTPVTEMLQSNRSHLEAILASERFAWEPASLPVRVADKTLFDAHGRYDMGEVRLLYALTRSFLGVLEYAQALEYSLNLSALAAYAELADTPLKNFEQRPADAILHSLALLLATDPNFLKLSANTGAARVKTAGEHFAATFDGLLSAVEFMKARRGDQSLSIVEYRRETDQDYFIVHIQFTETLSDKLDLTKFSDTTIHLKEDVTVGLARVRDSLAAQGGKRAKVQDDIFPIVALVGVLALSSGAFDVALEDVLDDIDPLLANELRATLGIAELKQSYFLAGMLTAVPTAMEIDLGRIFAEPSHPRDLMPAWRQPVTVPSPSAAGMEAYKQVEFVLEYECADNPLKTTSRRIFCTGASTDARHFAATGGWPWYDHSTYANFGPKWEGLVEKDGVAGPFASIGFKDPTFGGSLFVDVSAIAGNPLPTSGMQLANLRTLNAVIANTAEILVNLYGP